MPGRTPVPNARSDERAGCAVNPAAGFNAGSATVLGRVAAATRPYVPSQILYLLPYL